MNSFLFSTNEPLSVRILHISFLIFFLPKTFLGILARSMLAMRE